MFFHLYALKSNGQNKDYHSNSDLHEYQLSIGFIYPTQLKVINPDKFFYLQSKEKLSPSLSFLYRRSINKKNRFMHLVPDRN